MIKGATRRIIYDDTISNEDASRIAQAPIEPYNNAEINSMIKAKRMNKNKDISKQAKSKDSKQSKERYNREVTSLLMSVSTESELARLTILIESGTPLESLRMHINKGLSVLSYKG